MRTTLTLDDDVARLIEETMHRERRTMKDVVNQALRSSLGQDEEVDAYAIPVHHTSLLPGIDPARMNQLADELEDEAIIEKMRRDHS